MRRQSPCALLAPFALLLTLGIADTADAQTEFGAEVRLQIVTNGNGAAQPAAPATPARDDHIRALSNPSAEARVAAVRALGALGDAATVPALSRALQADPDPLVRGWIVRALQQIGTPDALAAVRAAGQRDVDARVRALVISLIPDAAPAPAPLVAPVVAAAPQYAYQMPMTRAERRAQRRAQNPGLGLRVSGWMLFGMSYVATICGGIFGVMFEPEVGGPLLIPLIGPAIGGTILAADPWVQSAGIGIMSWLVSAVQIAGFTMALVGHVRGRRARRAAEQQRSFSVIPTASADHMGLAAVGRF